MLLKKSKKLRFILLVLLASPLAGCIYSPPPPDYLGTVPETNNRETHQRAFPKDPFLKL